MTRGISLFIAGDTVAFYKSQERGLYHTNVLDQSKDSCGRIRTSALHDASRHEGVVEELMRLIAAHSGPLTIIRSRISGKSSLRKQAETLLAALQVEYPQVISTDRLKKLEQEFLSQFEQLPSYIQEICRATGMAVTMQTERRDGPFSIKRDRDGFRWAWGAIRGLADRRGVYFNSGKHMKPDVVREEVYHYVDYQLGDGHSDFTSQQYWRDAVDRDIRRLKWFADEWQAVPEHAENTKKAVTWLKEFVEDPDKGAIFSKGNVFFNPEHQLSDDSHYAEALVDVVKLEAVLKERMQKDGNLAQIPGISPYQTVDDVLDLFAPDIWRLYKGARPGKELIFHRDASTAELVDTQEAVRYPARCRVKSFVELCQEKAHQLAHGRRRNGGQWR